MKKIFILICAIFVVANVSAQTRKVGDVIMVNGELGIVFTVTSDGYHGKVMSCGGAVCNWNDAKALCANLNRGWRLPTIDELVVIYRNKSAINYALSANNNSPLSGNYWSSESIDAEFASGVHMSNCHINRSRKSSVNFMRAVSVF